MVFKVEQQVSGYLVWLLDSQGAVSDIKNISVVDRLSLNHFVEFTESFKEVDAVTCYLDVSANEGV